MTAELAAIVPLPATFADNAAAVFAPLGGGHSHEHGKSALDGHSHPDLGGSGAAPPPGPPTAPVDGS